MKEIADKKQMPNKQKKKVTVVRDSIVQNSTGCDTSWGGSVKIRYHPGRTFDDITDHIKPIAQKSPDVLVIHTGTNDFQDSIGTIRRVKNVVAVIKEVDKDNSTQNVFSDVLHREDHNFKEKTDH